MLHFYVDESGTGLGDHRSPYFLLAAIGIPASAWREIDAQVLALKRRLVSWAKPEDFEIKGRDLRRGEKFFKGQSWEKRAEAIHLVADLIAASPCSISAVQVDKRELPEYVGSDDLMYRLAFSRLLQEIDAELRQKDETGMLLIDARSTLHSSVQDRRLIDAYRDWVNSFGTASRLIEVPWFGFSAFYSGLQLADFAAYLIDFVTNEWNAAHGNSTLKEAFGKFEDKVRIVQIP